MYTCERNAVLAIRELGPGWMIFPYDEPDRGVLGYAASKKREELVFQWAMFGRELVPEVELVEATDLVAFLQSEPADVLYLCDAPQLRRLGFVSYRNAAEGRAIVRQTKLTSAKMLSKEDLENLMAARKNLGRFESRKAAADAIKPHGRLVAGIMRLVRRVFPFEVIPPRG